MICVGSLYRGNGIGVPQSLVRVLHHCPEKNEVLFHFCDEHGRRQTGRCIRPAHNFLDLFSLVQN